MLSVGARAQTALGEVEAPDLDVRVASFGLGGAIRSGEWAGLRIELLDQSVRERNLLISVSVVDMEGDTAVWQRLVPTNPGKRQSAWLYFRLPFTRAINQYTIEIHRAKEGASGEWLRDGDAIVRRFAQDGARRDSSTGFVGIIGPTAGSLAQVSALPGGVSASSVRIGGHERAEFIPGLRPDSLPDQWQGLRVFDALIWTAGSPGDLSIGSADAIREWVLRGGHLVVVLGSDAQEWTIGADLNRLHEILPRVRASETTNNIEPFRALLTRERDRARVSLPANLNVRTFEPTPDAGPMDAFRVLDGADGTCAVIRRVYGCGHVTFVGIDVASPALMAAGSLPDPEVFWHRVLGMRGRVYSGDEIRQRTFPSADRPLVFYDDSVADMINTTQEATAGVLLGFFVFGAYWLVAGPLSFAALKKKGWLRHAWVAFVASSLAFTVIAWGGATAIRKNRVQGTHVTLVEQVYGQPWSRARAWMNVLVPYYGDPRFAVDPPGRDSRSPEDFTHVMSAWERRTDVVGSAPFPDVRPYYVSSTEPSAIKFPSRATVKQVEVDWAGVLPEGMMPRVVTEDGAPGSITLLDSQRDRSNMSGYLVHGFDEPITNTMVFLVRRQTPVPGSGGRDSLIAQGNVWTRPGQWLPGERLDLRTVSASSTAADAITLYFNNANQSAASSEYLGVASAPDADDALMDLAFISMFPGLGPTEQNRKAAAVRAMTHGWDMGVWFTQPCVIVIGTIERDSESPVPLFVDGGRVPTEGRAIVRWVYPLPENPPAHPDGSAIEPDRSDIDRETEGPPEEGL